MDKVYNFYVVAELRDDLTKEEKKTALSVIEDGKQRHNIINIDDNSYCEAPPFEDIQDFCGTSFFYFTLEKVKNYFKKLAFYDVEEGVKDIAV